MRALIIGLIMLLAACSSTGQITPQSVMDFVRANCGFVVQAGDMAALITANPAIAGAAALGKKVCDAIQAQIVVPAKGVATATGGIVVVDGVKVHWKVAPHE